MGLISVPVQAAPQQIQVRGDGDTPIANAAVSVYVKGAKSSAPAGTRAEMGQRDKAFVPPLRVIQTGTALHFPNFDTVRHHVYSFSPTKAFEIKLYAGTPAAPVIFDKPGTATVGCNIHDRMLGYIHVVDTPYFGVTDASGNLTLDLPPGEHRARVWRPSMGEQRIGAEQAIKTGPATAVIQLPPSPSQ